jgi:hypothetical protein
MPLLSIAIVLIVIGIALWLIDNFSPVAAGAKTVLNVVVVVAVAIWILGAVGLLGRAINYRFVN